MEKLPKRDSARENRRREGGGAECGKTEDSRNCQNAIVCESGGAGAACEKVEGKSCENATVRFDVYGTSESGVNDERSDKKGRRCRIVVVVT